MTTTANKRSARPQATAQTWKRLPNAVARDKRLGAAALVFIAYRATFADDHRDYALHVGKLLANPIVRGPGFGRDVIKRSRRQCCEIGYLQRWQPPSSGHGSFGRAQERLTLPDCGASGKAGCIVRREWFNGTLSVKELAAYLYLLAGTGKGPRTYARELKDRFGWSAPTTAKVIKALIAAGRIAKVEMRARNGQIRCIGYQVQPLSKNQATKNQLTKNQSANVKNPPHELSSKEPPSRKGIYTSRPPGDEAAPPSEEMFEEEALLDVAFASEKLLASLLACDDAVSSVMSAAAR